MNLNNDFPQSLLNLPAREPHPFEEPILDGCEKTTGDVRCVDGQIRRYEDRIIVKNGQPAPFNRAGGLVNADNNTSDSNERMRDEEEEEKEKDQLQKKKEIAYLMQNVIHDAIYGRVIRGTVLWRRSANDVWIETKKQCAIKLMSWNNIRDGRDCNRAENPQDEIAAMQHLMRFFNERNGGQEVTADFAMGRTRLIMAFDFLYDDENVYIVTPFCTEDLCDRLTNRETNRFTEDESRHFFRSILVGVESLHNAGLTHKCIGLEDIMVNDDIMLNENITVIIDMGMCLRIPRHNNNQRCLIASRPRCGKPSYIAPEVFGEMPFDGHAVDMWAVGVCLFMMLTGETPWNIPREFDRRFKAFVLEQGLSGWLAGHDANLSDNAADLLQKMLSHDPQMRLSLQQVRDHPWMNP